MDRTSKNSKIIKAGKEKTYRTFTDQRALAYWLAPYGMTGQIRNFNLMIGGGYEMSLYYKDKEKVGKTSANEDRFTATFIELKPFDKIIQSINFHTDKNDFSGEMVMEVFLEKIESYSTKVIIVFKNIPVGIHPKDNETGTAQSLVKLAEYIETKDKS